MSNYPEGINRMNDYLNRDVQLVREIETQGGAVFRKGEKFKVSSHHRGRLTLSRRGSAKLRQVSRCDVQLLERSTHA